MNSAAGLMSAQGLLLIREEHCHLSEGVVAGDTFALTNGTAEYIGSGTLEELCEQNSRMLIVMPVAWCAYKRIFKEENKNFDYLSEHLPFYIEDELIAHIEDLEIFWRVKNLHIDAYVIASDVYRRVRECLRIAHVELQDIIAEQEFFFEKYHNVALVLRDRLILVGEEGEFLTAEPSSTEILFSHPAIQGRFSLNRFDQTYEDFLRGLIVRVPPDACSLLDREQRFFRQARGSWARLEPFLRAIALACSFFITYQFGAGIYFAKRAAAINQYSAGIFQQKLGPDRMFSEAESMAKTQLRERGRIIHYKFLTQLQMFAQARGAAGANDIRIEAIRFGSTRGLVLDVVFQDFPGFQRFSRELKKLTSLELREINNQDGALRATITLF